MWLGNTRGNDHGLSHKTLSVDSREFWDFSFHEIGFYDLPAMFDLMLKVTNTSRGFYFGHSQGGSSFAVMTSMRPEYNTKVIQAHLLAPAIFMENFPHPLAGLATLLFEVSLAELIVLNSTNYEREIGDALKKFRNWPKQAHMNFGTSIS